MTAQIYLDFNATAPIRSEVIEAVAVAMRTGGNASSVHATGRAARTLIDEARDQVAKLVNAAAENVIFVGSGTEADNQILRCTGRDHAVISSIEHEAVRYARADVIEVPVLPSGILDLGALQKILGRLDTSVIVSVMAANNETGVLQPVEEISRLAHAHDALVHTDAIQAAGKIPLDLVSMGVDFVSLSAHKIGGPQGVGAIVCRDPTTLDRFVHGGGQESGLRAGTENVAGIAGFGVAAECAREGLQQFAALSELRDGLETQLKEIAKDIKVFGGDQRRLPNTTKFATPGLSSDVQVLGLDLEGIAISAGSACAAGRVEAPYVLTAMGVEEALAVCAVRISLGWTTTANDIDRLVKAWFKLYERMRKRAVPAAE